MNVFNVFNNLMLRVYIFNLLMPPIYVLCLMGTLFLFLRLGAFFLLFLADPMFWGMLCRSLRAMLVQIKNYMISYHYRMLNHLCYVPVLMVSIFLSTLGVAWLSMELMGMLEERVKIVIRKIQEKVEHIKEIVKRDHQIWKKKIETFFFYLSVTALFGAVASIWVSYCFYGVFFLLEQRLAHGGYVENSKNPLVRGAFWIYRRTTPWAEWLEELPFAIEKKKKQIAQKLKVSVCNLVIGHVIPWVRYLFALLEEVVHRIEQSWIDTEEEIEKERDEYPQVQIPITLESFCFYTATTRSSGRPIFFFEKGRKILLIQDIRRAWTETGVFYWCGRMQPAKGLIGFRGFQHGLALLSKQYSVLQLNREGLLAPPPSFPLTKKFPPSPEDPLGKLLALPKADPSYHWWWRHEAFRGANKMMEKYELTPPISRPRYLSGWKTLFPKKPRLKLISSGSNPTDIISLGGNYEIFSEKKMVRSAGSPKRNFIQKPVKPVKPFLPGLPQKPDSAPPLGQSSEGVTSVARPSSSRKIAQAADSWEITIEDCLEIDLGNPRGGEDLIEKNHLMAQLKDAYRYPSPKGKAVVPFTDTRGRPWRKIEGEDPAKPMTFCQEQEADL